MSATARPIGRIQQTLLALAALAFSVAVGWIDGEFGPAVSLWLFHLLPIAAVGWFVGREAGVGMAALAALLVVNAQAQGWDLANSFWESAWSAVSVCVLFGLTAIATSRMENRLREQAQLAREDLLTRMPNLLSFTEQLPARLNSAGRRAPVTLGLVEVHGIAYINERFGTKAGDLILRVTADTLRDSLRRGDLVSRVGGTTFAVVLPDTGEAAATELLEAARDRVLSQIHLYDRPVTVAVAAVSTENPSAQGQDLMDRTGWLLQTIKQERSQNPFRVVGDEGVHA
jgi:diguanylate cyclase (GGDEF)-like protein